MWRSTAGLAGTITAPVAVLTRTSRRQRERLEGREVLGDPAAPRDAEHVGLLVAQRRQQARHHAGTRQ